MRNNTQPTLETIQQFHDLRGDLWCVQIYYPKGKGAGNDRYWIGTITNISTNESRAVATIGQLDHEVRKLRQPTLNLW